MKNGTLSEWIMCIIIFVLIGIIIIMKLNINNQYMNHVEKLHGEYRYDNREAIVLPISIEKIKPIIQNVKTQHNYTKALSHTVKDEVYAVVTGYSSSKNECDDDPFIGAFNTKVGPGTIAVSPYLYKRGWKKGHKVYIEGIGVKIINDKMSKKYSHVPRIDVWVKSKTYAYKIGNKPRTVILFNIPKA